MKIYLSYRERVAGIFLVLAALIVILFIAGAAIQNRWFVPRVSFHTIVVRGEGLRSGSPVLLSGIEVGEVGELVLLDDNRIDVELVILERHADRIHADTRAKVRRLMGIGEKRILLISATGKGLKLAPGSLIAGDEPMDLLDVVSEVDLGKYLATMDRALTTMDQILSKLEEDNRMARMFEAFDELGPVLRSTNALLSDIQEPVSELFNDPSLKRTFKGTDKLFNNPATHKAMQNMAKSFDPEKIDKVFETIDKTTESLDRLLAEDSDMSATLKGANRLMNDGRMDRMLTSMEKLTDAEKLEGLVNNMALLAEQMAKIGPEIPTMSRELTATMRELSVVLKALQKTWILDDEVDEVRSKMKKKSTEKKADED